MDRTEQQLNLPHSYQWNAISGECSEIEFQELLIWKRLMDEPIILSSKFSFLWMWLKTI